MNAVIETNRLNIKIEFTTDRDAAAICKNSRGFINKSTITVLPKDIRSEGNYKNQNATIL
ncbi:MAG TPA: hypothetical protein VLB84_17660 [Bacteroidia bacterium]|nr:hypothetical protein [Bacteroidia bacterium]